jgi:cytochrome bd ubiquinol oxidase subunit II
MVLFWFTLLAVGLLLYVLLDGFDLGVGMLSGLTRSEARRRTMLSAVAPVWDGNETWLVSSGVVLWGAFPLVYATLQRKPEDSRLQRHQARAGEGSKGRT